MPPAASLVQAPPAALQRLPVRERTMGAGLVLAGILLVALNLRAAITSLGALLPEVSQGLGLTAAEAGMITTLPALSFAVFGTFTPHLTRRFSTGQILIGAMAMLVAGQGARVFTDSAAIFLISSALAMAGIAVANVLLPALVKQYFPDRAGLVTGVYTMTMITGTTAASAASVPIANAFGSWRVGLGVWTVMAAVAAVPWLHRAATSRAATRATAAVEAAATTGQRKVQRRLRVSSTRLGWAMAIYFGAQSLSGYATMGWLAQIFRDAAFSPANAGLLLAGVTAFGVPIALLMPTIAGKTKDLRPLVLIMSAGMILSYLGLVFSPHNGAVLWVALLAVGQGAFPLALAMIGMRARTTQGIVALSAFAQSTGYLIAALGPLLVGVLHELTGGWTLPLGFLIAAAVVQTFAGLAVARPRFIEDKA